MKHLDEGALGHYLAGEIDSDERLEIERHLAECPACSGLRDTLAAVLSDMTNPNIDGSDRFVSTVMNRVRLESARRAASEPVLSSWDRIVAFAADWFVPAVACTAALLLVLWSGPIGSGDRANSGDSNVPDLFQDFDSLVDSGVLDGGDDDA